MIPDTELPIVDQARKDPNVWAEYFSGQPQAQLHRDIQAAYDAHLYLLVEGPPEVGKSQQITLRRVLWEIGRDPNVTIGIVGAKAEQSYEWIRAIRDGIESIQFRRCFPNVKPGSLWTTERLQVVRPSRTITSPTVQGIGIGGTFLGARLNVIVLDDILNAINTATKEQRRKTLEWIDSSMCAGRLLAGGRLVILGNTWTSDDAIHELAKRQDSEGRQVYHYFRRPVSDPGITLSNVPEIWPVDRIKERRDLVGESRFRWQYLLEPRGLDDSRFRPEWLELPTTKRWSPPPRELAELVREIQAPDTKPEERAKLRARAERLAAYRHGPGERIVIGMDIGVGLQERHDQTAWVVMVADEHNVRHVIYTEKTRATGPDLIARMVALEYAFPGCVWRVETVAAQRFLAQFAAQHLRNPVASHSTTGGASTSITNKAWGMEQLAVRAEGGQLRFALEANGRVPKPVEDLRGGLLWYTPREHTADDVMALLFAEVQLTRGGQTAKAPPRASTPGSRLLKGDA
jgi:hypothetical protein